MYILSGYKSKTVGCFFVVVVVVVKLYQTSYGNLKLPRPKTNKQNKQTSKQTNKQTKTKQTKNKQNKN